MIYERILQLVDYGKNKNLLAEDDRIFTINSLLELLELDEIPEDVINAYNSNKKDDVINCESQQDEYLSKILEEITDYAYEKGIIKENTVTYRVG